MLKLYQITTSQSARYGQAQNSLLFSHQYLNFQLLSAHYGWNKDLIKNLLDHKSIRYSSLLNQQNLIQIHKTCFSSTSFTIFNKPTSHIAVLNHNSLFNRM